MRHLGLILVLIVTACTPLANPTPSAATPTLEPSISEFPAAGICAGFEGEIVTININIDMPDPRCVEVTAQQKLRVVNNTTVEAQVSIAGYATMLGPGEEWLVDKPVGGYLALGVHRLNISSAQLCCGAEIWLVEE